MPARGQLFLIEVNDFHLDLLPNELAGVHEGAVPHVSQAICCAELFATVFVEIDAVILSMRNVTDREYFVAKPRPTGENLPIGNLVIKDTLMIRIATPQDLGHAVRAARKQLGLTQAQLSLAAGVGLRFIVDLEAGKPTLRLEHVLRVVDSLGGEFTLNGFASNHSGTAPTAANAHDARAARLRALDELTAQAQELKMGYE